jgi:hypothetical protein
MWKLSHKRWDIDAFVFVHCSITKQLMLFKKPIWSDCSDSSQPPRATSSSLRHLWQPLLLPSAARRTSCADISSLAFGAKLSCLPREVTLQEQPP